MSPFDARKQGKCQRDYEVPALLRVSGQRGPRGAIGAVLAPPFGRITSGKGWWEDAVSSARRQNSSAAEPGQASFLSSSHEAGSASPRVPGPRSPRPRQRGLARLLDEDGGEGHLRKRACSKRSHPDKARPPTPLRSLSTSSSRTAGEIGPKPGHEKWIGAASLRCTVASSMPILATESLSRGLRRSRRPRFFVLLVNK